MADDSGQIVVIGATVRRVGGNQYTMRCNVVFEYRADTRGYQKAV
jgi:hypothetical protein